MTLTERLDMAKRLVEAGVIRDTEGAIAAIRAMEPTRPVHPPEAKPVDVARRIEEQISGAYSRQSRGVMVGLEASLPPEETKPPARAHLKDHAPDCRTVHAPAESCTEANVPSRPALSPRQALGEALACVERAKHLLESVCTAPAGVHVDVRLAVFRAYAGAETAWANAVSAQAHLASGESK